ncbi:sensor histidine kinase [Saccharopolyspora gloriosae]|uniref:histidine kinase n=1 Tax=Saccharopolyspora gloriosae TaxID=455344 RepID=A0A840N6Q4_9PSEU|nr:sensor histidine kinase [Saccharopolyspora gloriosae]MBB5067650.1 signal transduction histidine kinase [Saccharopolyspora gloriosae]
MTTAITRSGRATAVLLDGLRTALPAAFGATLVPLLLLLLPLAPEVVRPVRALADLERERVGRVLGHRIPAPYQVPRGGWWRRFRIVARDPATWRDLVWLVSYGALSGLVAVFVIALPPAVGYSLTMPAWWWLLPPGAVTAFVEVRSWPQALTLPFLQAACYAALYLWGLPPAVRGLTLLSGSLLRPTDRARLAARVERLTETRTDAVESHGAELRRIERDLHDGVQAQLVAVSVRLGLAERAFTADPDAARAMLREAREGIEDSLGGLRGLIRGIYPPILADRGLGGAVHALADGRSIPVAVRLPEVLARPPAPVEAAAYFVVAESLTNMTKHSTARHAEVTIDEDGDSLRVVIRDDGRGGADPDGGTGLLGIRRRVAALDGTARIDSPAGGGTTIEVRLPCA